MSKHTLSVLVENKPGVLARIAGLFSRRGFNIDSLAVGPTEHPEISRMTIEVNAEESPIEQDTKLWFDQARFRFLIATDMAIIDDLSPMEFIQFVREMREVKTKVVFKFETKNDGTNGRARRIWG